MIKGTAKFLDAEAIDFDLVSDEWLSLNLGGEKYVMDLDTLIDLSFRCTSLLAYLEHRYETNSKNFLDAQCECVSTKSNIH